MRQHFLIRNQVASALDQRGVVGGSRSLQAQGNSDLRNYFYSQVGNLVVQNPAFGEFYTRWLESDRLERGSG